MSAGPCQVGQGCVKPPVIPDEISTTGYKPVGWPASCEGRSTGHTRGLADQMNHAALRHVPTFPTHMRRPEAKIRFLIIHEVFLVERADRVQHLSADQHACS